MPLQLTSSSCFFCRLHLDHYGRSKKNMKLILLWMKKNIGLIKRVSMLIKNMRINLGVTLYCKWPNDPIFSLVALAIKCLNNWNTHRHLTDWRTTVMSMGRQCNYLCTQIFRKYLHSVAEMFKTSYLDFPTMVTKIIGNLQILWIGLTMQTLSF